MPSFYLKKFNLAAEIVAAGTTMFLSACGDSGATENIYNQTGLDIVASAADLPKCTDDNEGDQTLVKDENAIRYCLDGKWVALEGSAGDTVYVSRVDTVVVTSNNYSCETKPLADSSGIAIYCGGDSIGVVYNGASGAQGEKGDAGDQGVQGETGATGAGCSVDSSTDTTVTVKCGDDSFVMKLNGGSSSVIDTSSSETYEVENASVTGVSQKGPFVNGSKVTLYELVGNRTLSQTGRTFGGNITTNDGKFTVNNVSLVSGYARLEATGFYRNEVTGNNSAASITLNAYTDLGDRQKVNINLLTHLEYYRVNYLMANSDGTLKVKTAKKQAEREIFRSVFGIDASSFGYSEDLDVFGTGDGDAALLALSILLQGDRSEADLTALLTAFGQDIQKDGAWNGTTANGSAKTWRDSIADWALEQDLAGNLATFRTNVANWGLGDVPPFEKYIRKYYGTELGLGGNCGDDVDFGTVKEVSNKNSAYFADGYINQSNTTRYICDNSKKVWRVAIDIEKDTMDWGHNFSEGNVRNGKINTTITYVYEDGNWRLGTAIDSLMYKQKDEGGVACIKAALNDTSKVKANNLYYVCSTGTADTTYHWVEAPTAYNDTYENRSNCTSATDGDLMNGRINASTKYVCDYGAISGWRTASLVEATLGGCTETREADVSKNTGKVNGIWYICKSRVWESTNNITVDTQGWVDGSDGSLKKGDSTETYYKYDEFQDKWVTANDNDVSLGLMGCTTNRTGEIGKGSDSTYYVCKNSAWQKAAEIDYDTYGSKCTATEVGSTVNGRVTAANKYYCSANGWISMTDGWSWDVPKEARLNPDIEYGTMTDERDGQTYKTVVIGEQTWMAENLNYADSVSTPSLKGKSWCYENNDKYCAVTGRLYTWAAAIDSVAFANDADNPQTCGYGVTCTLPTMVQGICPEGWHIPNNSDWSILFTFIGGTDSAGTKLKSSSGWKSSGNGEDSFGFSGLPAGDYCVGSFEYVGSFGYFWSSAESNTGTGAYSSTIRYRYAYTNVDAGYTKRIGFSVRCLKN